MEEDYAKNIYPKLLDKDEKRAVRGYTSFGYIKINKGLRADDFVKFNEQIERIDRAIDKYNCDDKLTLYRFLHFYPTLLEKYLKSLEKGLYLEKGYLSTSSTLGRIDDYNIIYKINIPDSSLGAYIKYVSTMKVENEYLIKRGNILEIENIEKKVLKRGKTKYFIDAKIKDNIFL